MPDGPSDEASPWRDLAARAATLNERLRGEVVVPAGGDQDGDDATADARLARWREVAARGDATRFADVLAAHGLTDVADARRRLRGPVRLPPGAPLPAWVRLARQLTRRPPVACARTALRRRVGPAVYANLARRAHAALEAHLAARLHETAAGARDVERQVRRALLPAGAAPAAEEPEPEIPLTELFPHYPVLARLSAGLVRDWVAANAEFLRRLHRDRSRLAATFFPETRDPGPVTGLEAGAGDAHRGGRSVLLLRFAGGRRLVYKPRDVNPERAWADAVDRVNAAGFRPPLRAGRVLPRGRGAHAYGWMEWVPAAPRRGRAARDHYGRRAGALACLFHVLGGTDGHRDNVVAAGEHPVLVDAETLAHPSPPPDVAGRTAAMERFTRSVLRTFLVPFPAAFLPPVRDGANDGPAALAIWVPPAGFERRPRDDGGPPPARPRLDVPGGALLAGFRAMACLLASPPGARLRARIRRALAGRAVRRVWLPTALYDELRRRSLSARGLRDGVDRGIELGWLRRMEGTPRTPADVDAETRALDGLDIPYFAARATPSEDAPWLGAKPPDLARHLGEQAELLARVFAALRPAAIPPAAGAGEPTPAGER